MFTDPLKIQALHDLLNGNPTKEVSYQKRPNLLVAKTIAHEVIHAEMLRKLISLANNNGNIDVPRLSTMLQNGDYPGMLDYYTRFGLNGFQHQQMAAFYIETIAQGLKQFDNGQHSDTFYEALAWEGLAQYKDANNNHELIFSEAWKKLSPNEQQEILNTITNEKQNGSKECN
ncbi:MAG: hypothetical protein ACPF80_02585 [Flavobacteriaceae bacterium]